MKITSNIHQVQIDFNIRVAPDKLLPRFVNVLIIFGEKITIVDTGVKGSEETIFNYIAQNGRSIKDIDTLLLSHAHPDHIGSAARIKELTGCKVLAHENERRWIENIEIQDTERPVPGFRTLVDRPVKVDGTLRDGEMLALGNTNAEVLFTPGHSAGLVSLLFQKDGVFFTGDAIPLRNDIPNYDNYFKLMASLERIASRKDYTTLLSSWTPAIFDSKKAVHLIEEGIGHLKLIDSAVGNIYTEAEKEYLQYCKKTLSQLGLPLLLANSVVDNAFRSHLRTNG